MTGLKSTLSFLIASMCLAMGCTPAIIGPFPSGLRSFSYLTPSSNYTINVPITENRPSTPSSEKNVSYSISPSLPVGLAINSSTGAITGVPFAITASADYTVTLKDSLGSVTTPLTIAVNDVPPSNLTYQGDHFYFVLEGPFQIDAPTTLGGTVTSYTVSPPLPAGIVLDSSTGAIAVNPTEIAPYITYVITAANSGGKATANLKMGVSQFGGVAVDWDIQYGMVSPDPQAPVYGTKGHSDPGNTPGSRYGGCSWIDAFWNFWYFGGVTITSGGIPSFYNNDLWMWDGATWTWMAGSNSNQASGVYGNLGEANSANTPGGRISCQAATDTSGNLILFGGSGFASVGSSGSLNDIWKWDGTTWTWIGGDNTANSAVSYGTPGFASGSNNPGGRSNAAMWLDLSDHLWIFGGNINGSLGANDLWKWDGSQWTFVSGKSEVETNGVYGTRGVASALNQPGSRKDFAYWRDPDGNFWLFGGAGVGASQSDKGYLNDLWKWDGTAWTWIAGDKTTGAVADYGELAFSYPTNKPGARYGVVGWSDHEGNPWIFGGANAPSGSYLNDLWHWNGTTWVWVSGSKVPNDFSDPQRPGPRAFGSATVLNSSSVDKMFVFGGYARSEGANVILSDFWRFQTEP